MNGNSKLWAVVSYITLVGWFIALFCRDRSDRLVRQHLNQALILNVLSIGANLLNRIGGLFGTIGSVIGLVLLVFWVWGLIRAVKGSDEPLPFIGDIMHIQ